MKNKKNIFISIGIITAVVIGGAGTFAYLSARRIVQGSKATVGTIDLDVTANGNQLEPFIIENMGENANISGTKTWTIKNTGTLPGRFLFRLQNLSNKDNGCNDQEKDIEPACEANDEGELGNLMDLKIAVDGVQKASSTLATANQSAIGQAWNALAPIILAPNETKSITASWAVDESAYGNEIQSDSVGFNADFRLIQLINGPTPSN